MRMDEAFKNMEKMFKRNFPSQTKGKDSAAVRKIMREMGYGFGTGLNKEMRKSGGKSRFKDGGSVRPIIKVDKDGKIRQTGKKRLKDGTISVQPEGGIKFIPNKNTLQR